MTKHPQTPEDLVLIRLHRLNTIVNGIVTGLLAGLGLLVATLWLVVKGGDVVGPHLGLLGQFFIGYRVSVLGSFIGFLYGFVVGFLTGCFISYVYNWLVDRLEGSHAGRS